MAVGIDAISSASVAAVASLTWAHTVNGSERLLVVGVSFNPGAGRNVSSVTYNGAAMTAAGNRAGSNDEIAIYYLVNPDLGTNNVVVTFNTSVTEAVAGAISLTGVDQAAPIGTFASNATSSSNASVSVTGLANGIIVDTVAWSYAPTPTGGPTTGQTQAWKVKPSNVWGGASTKAVSGATTMVWDFNGSTEWVIGALPVRASTALPVGGQMMLRSGS